MMKLRRIRIDTYKENVAFMRSDCPVCASQGFNSQTKIEIVGRDRSLVAVLDVLEEPYLRENELGLCAYAFDRLGLPEGSDVWVKHPEPVQSFEYIKRKLDGHEFQPDQLREIVHDIVAGRYSKIELTAFVLSCAQSNLNREEIVWLTEAMVATGDQIDWTSNGVTKPGQVPFIVDKHSIGGIPGNRTTMIIVPIVAAFGLKIPKTSSRAITSACGTADAMETLTEVDLPLARLKEIVAHESGCIAWGGAVDLSPADDIIIQVERPLSMDSEGQMVASILSKKRSAGSTHVLLDLPLGPTTKIRSRQKAMRLLQKFEYVGEKMGLYVECLIGEVLQPIGRGIGPSLEARDVLAVLQNHSEGLEDLKNKSVQLAGRVLEFSPEVRPGRGEQVAAEILASGRAWEKMQALIRAQGQPKELRTAAFHYDIPADRDGVVHAIDNYRIGRLAKLTGAPQDPTAGLDLFKKVGERFEQGEPLLRLYAETKEELAYAREYWESNREMITVT